MEKELMILVGPIGVGKTTFSEFLENDTSIRISQDEMGRKAYLKHFRDALEDEVPRIIIDRMNFNREQRERFIKPARENGYVITMFIFEWDTEICLKRVVKRDGHPTIPKGKEKLAKEILQRFKNDYEKPTKDEYDNYNLVRLDYEY